MVRLLFFAMIVNFNFFTFLKPMRPKDFLEHNNLQIQNRQFTPNERQQSSY